MNFPPQVCLMGAQKAGTTTLASILDSHPGICVATNKEPCFYTHNWHRGLDWYRDQFSPASESAVLVDASPSFTEAPLRQPGRDDRYSGVPEKVHSVNPATKFIYLIRDPVERTYSGYMAAVRHDLEFRPFSEAMFDPDRRYLDTSNYHGQLSLWLEHFDLSSFLILTLDELRLDPERVFRKCLNFMNLEYEAPPEKVQVENKSYSVGWLGRKLNRAMLSHPDLIRLKMFVPQFVLEAIKGIKRGRDAIPPIDETASERLRDYFRPHNDDLSRLTGLSLESWS